jgi:hypothetical protein
MTVDVTYRGLKVATGARLVPSGPGTGFVEVETPLPVGARLVLSGELAKEARVTGVVEQEAGTKTVAGMRIAWDEVGASVQPAVKAPAARGSELPAATLETKPVAAPAEPRASDSASVTSPTIATTSAREAAAEAEVEPEPEPEPGDSASISSPPAPPDDTTTTGGGGARRRRRRKNASRS